MANNSKGVLSTSVLMAGMSFLLDGLWLSKEVQERDKPRDSLKETHLATVFLQLGPIFQGFPSSQ